MIRRLAGAAIVFVVEFWRMLISTPATLTTADRDVESVLAGNVYVVVPEPVPVDVESVTHEADEEIVQAHVEPVVTVMVPLPPPGAAATSSGLTENEHDGLGSVTMKLRPAMDSVALRSALVVLPAAVKLTVPGPLRFVPFEIVTHAAPLVAFQVHPAVVVTVTDPLPPAAPSAWLPGEIANEHGAAAWSSVKVCPPTVIVPVRAIVAVLAATAYDTAPLPSPEAPAVIVIHASLLVAVQAQPVAAVTVTVPAAPAATALAEAGAIAGVHGTPACVTVNVFHPTLSSPVRSNMVVFAATL
jgi:hypothetical protein